MFQVIFNPVSASEMSARPEDLRSLNGANFSTIRRDGRTLHRFRCLDHRIYFERHDEGIIIHRVLHKNTIRDFLFRSKLPMNDGDDQGDQAESTDQFWKMIQETPAATTGEKL